MIKEMKYVYEIYKKKSFSKAAESLFISQPALSAIIKRLEKRIGTDLFDRSTNPIRLTEAGCYYIEAIEKIMSIEENMEAYFQDLQNLNKGSLRIAATSFFCSYSLPMHLKPFKEKYPGIKLELIEEYHQANMENMLNRGDVDFVLSSNPINMEHFQKQFFYQEQLILAVPKKCKINESLQEYQLSFKDILEGRQQKRDCPKVSLANFKDEDFLLLKNGSELYQRSQIFFKNAGISPNIVMYLDQMPTAYYMTCHGFGISIIRDTTVHITPAPENDSEQVVFYKIDDELATRDIYFYYRGDLSYSATARAFLTYTKEVAATASILPDEYAT